MAGSQSQSRRAGRFATVFALSFFTIVWSARAQNRLPGQTYHEFPEQTFAELVDAESSPWTTTAPASGSGPSYYPVTPYCPDPTLPEACVEMGLFDVMGESIFGKPDPNCWRPLSLSTLFSEGWDESWVPSPSGSGGAPRQGWINAADGNLYRLWFFTFSQGFNDPPEADAYLGSYTLLTPLNRRLMLITNIPFVLHNNAATGLPINDPNQLTVSTTQSHTTFGDISITPRVLLHETQDFSLTAELAVVMPTGNEPLAGRTLLVPAVAFWNNFAGGWVIRGGLGVSIPTEGSAGDTLISQLAVGQTVTDHNLPLFGDFTYYVSAVAGTPLSNGGQTSVALTPGVRTHLGDDWYLLAGMPIPLTTERVADLGLIFWFMKAW